MGLPLDLDSQPNDPKDIHLAQRIFRHITDGGIVVAHNAAFERVMWNAQCKLGALPKLKAEQMVCTAAKGGCHGVAPIS